MFLAQEKIGLEQNLLLGTNLKYKTTFVPYISEKILIIWIFFLIIIQINTNFKPSTQKKVKKYV